MIELSVQVPNPAVEEQTPQDACTKAVKTSICDEEGVSSPAMARPGGKMLRQNGNLGDNNTMNKTALLAAVLLLAGCSGTADSTEAAPGSASASASVLSAVPSVSTSESSATPTSEAPAVIPEAQRYASLEALRDALVGAGYPCSAWEVLIDGTAAQCDEMALMQIAITKPEEELLQSGIDLSLTAIEQADRRGDIGLLRGPNWFVRLGMMDAKTLQAILGGDIEG